jgi:hypothetical protein
MKSITIVEGSHISHIWKETSTINLLEKADASADCSEFQFKSHDLYDENNGDQMEDIVQAPLEAVENDTLIE